MLNEEEKARIRAEEIFRSEIREELETHMPPPSRRERLWLLLNSSFALWFLSSIVLGGLTTGFAYYESWRRAQERKVEIERRLDTEISSRIESALYGLRADKVRIDQGEVYAPRWIYGNTQSHLDNFFVADPSNLRDFSIYPEYQKRNFRALIYELRSSVAPSLRPELTDALTSYEQLLSLGSTENDKAKDKSESLEAVEKAFEFVDSKLRKSRWREPRWTPCDYQKLCLSASEDGWACGRGRRPVARAASTHARADWEGEEFSTVCPTDSIAGAF